MRADLADARLARLRACDAYDVRFVIRLQEHRQPKVDGIARGQVTQECFPGTDLEALREAEPLVLDGRDPEVLCRRGARPMGGAVSRGGGGQAATWARHRRGQVARGTAMAWQAAVVGALEGQL